MLILCVCVVLRRVYEPVRSLFDEFITRFTFIWLSSKGFTVFPLGAILECLLKLSQILVMTKIQSNVMLSRNFIVYCCKVVQKLRLEANTELEVLLFKSKSEMLT